MSDIRLDQAGPFWRASFTAMGGPCELLCETQSQSQARDLAELAANEAWRIEKKFSRYAIGNIVHRINTALGQPVLVDEETASLLDFSAKLYELSQGCFDITSGVLREAWTFDGSDRVPTRKQVSSALQRVGWHKVDWRNKVLWMPPGMEIDLGGVGKEYAVDRAAGLVRHQSGLPCLVNFGGDLAATAPPANSGQWLVGRDSVTGANGSPPAQAITLRSGAIATSGDTRRYLLRNGRRYSHILDPRTGWPVRDAPATVTVAAATCVQAGMLCTLAALKGADAEQMLDDEGVTFWCTRE